jgi:hypothetical protein
MGVIVSANLRKLVHTEQIFLKSRRMVRRGERMRRILIVLLVAGLLVGTFAAIEEPSEVFFRGDINFSNNDSELTEIGLGGPAPCGGGESGGSGGTPG